MFHREHQDQPIDLTVDDLANLVFAKYGKEHPLYSKLLEQLKTLDVSNETCQTLLKSLLLNKQLRDLSVAAYEATEGRLELPKLKEKLTLLTFEDNATEAVLEAPFVDDDLQSIIQETYAKPGLRWRLKTLNRMLGSLRKGDFGFLFARPETGKTTFLTSEVSHMASQLPDDSGPILWFNNEEQHKKVLLRCYQAALGATLETVMNRPDEAQKEYYKRTKGKVKLVNQSIITKQIVEKYCKEHNPSLIIFDQIDKISGFDADRDDLLLGKVYQWAREIAKQYCPVIAVCQADGSGENVKWLTMNNVANAKTSKQAEADWILGIGKINEPGYDNLRYLHLSKNKLMGDPDTEDDLRHGRMEVLIQPNIARYKDIH